MNLELDARLRALAAYARRRSFSAAAEELAISQPALSKHVAELERRLRVPLVVHGRRGGGLTAAGTFLADYVLRAEAILAQAETGLQAYREPGGGRLSIAASGSPGTYLLPRPLARFHEIHPGVEILTELATSAEVVDAVRSHRFELGLVGGLAAAPEIEAEPLLGDEIVVISGASARGRRVSLHDLERSTWISREEGSATRAAVEAAWKDLGIAPARRLELPSWEAVKLAVAAGAGVAACSRLAVEVELAAGSLKVLSIPRWRVRRTISAIRVRHALLSPPAERFLELLRREARSRQRHVGAAISV